MPLYKYKKAPVQYKRQYRSRKPQSSEVVLEIQREPLTIWKLLQGIKNDITEILTTSRFAGTVVPAICIIYGLNLLLGQIIPSATQFIQAQTGGLEQGALAIVPSNFVSAKQSFLSDPGSTYFEQIQQNAKRARVLEIDPVSNSYNGIFSLSIPNLNLSNLSVQANTNSGVETIYDQVLENGLAHMESTGLPISSTPNNIVIYGHSAGGDYYKRTGDPAAAFTILTDIKLGDTIDVTIEGKDYSYKVSKTKIVEPTDLSIIAGEGNPSIQTLTLFTCYPPGNNANRYVVTAVPTEI